MIRQKFLRRFQRLENRCPDTLPKDLIEKHELKLTKRFARLEVNDKRIELTITDKVSLEEKMRTGKGYTFLCPYCAHENPSESETCASCKQKLGPYVSYYSNQAQLLKQCACGAVNLKERRNCWVCGRDFSLYGEKEVKENPENVITLSIDGQIYRSSDPALTGEIRELMGKIRREGYSEKLINEWLAQRNTKIDAEQARVETRLTELRYGMFWRIVGIIAILVITAIGFGTCARF